jgi:hypothetical protein
MWLQAILTPTDLEGVLAELTPVKIVLDQHDADRYLWLDRPTHVESVGEAGLRIATSVRLQWDLIGIEVPLTLGTVTLLLAPSIKQIEGRDVLAFSVCMEHADLSGVPGAVAERLISRVNEALSAEHAKLTWPFMETLDFHFKLPSGMEPPRALHLFAKWGALRMTEEGVAMAASFALDTEPAAAHEEETDPGDANARDLGVPRRDSQEGLAAHGNGAP